MLGMCSQEPREFPVSVCEPAPLGRFGQPMTSMSENIEVVGSPMRKRGEEFTDWYDPCPLSVGGIFQIDGLNQPWRNRTYVNPPYSEPLKWVKKAVEENKKGKTVALLLKLDCSTDWFRKIMEAGAHILMVNERLHFNEGEAAPFCSVIFILYGSLNNRKTVEK